MIMLNEDSFANFINIEVRGHCLTFIQGHLKLNFEISFTQKKLPGQFKLYHMLGLIRLKGMKMKIMQMILITATPIYCKHLKIFSESV